MSAKVRFERGAVCVDVSVCKREWRINEWIANIHSSIHQTPALKVSKLYELASSLTFLIFSLTSFDLDWWSRWRWRTPFSDGWTRLAALCRVGMKVCSTICREWPQKVLTFVHSRCISGGGGRGRGRRPPLISWLLMSHGKLSSLTYGDYCTWCVPLTTIPCV